ncbi:hypothetical protein V1286_007751 [Bradyrhizobium algeriense]|uniref:Uncharacterized protein n=1 Tax=Bradyrhizobium algeriense TaxID=634784 RepID=A0ABU8BNT3_9BRAD
MKSGAADQRKPRVKNGIYCTDPRIKYWQLWVIPVILTAGGSLPVYPRKQTFWSSVGMSQRGQTF